MKILIAVDGSEQALDAVRYALRLHLAGLQASFVLATVQESTYLVEVLLRPDAEVLERVAGAPGARALAGAQALFRDAGVPFESEIGGGDPASVLIKIAGNLGCDALILGARGMGAVRSALIGSVSQAVLAASEVPVTLVKHNAPNAAQ